ncbi:MAG: bifunctional oligoribonuclease/PAP phosphatase NrnA [Chitinophagaceae bacterium]|nr:bifunctional oligoribonuclease/PAP phosphatase NrnA [Chitinophagaceae bacterium]
MKPIQEIYPLLSTPRRIVITMHQKPDPDAMGSSLALAGVLSQLGHDITVISPTNWPDFLKWMPGCKNVIDFEAAKEKALSVLDTAEWLFCLDFNAMHRTKHLAQHLKELNCIKILIDHHEQPETASFDYGISLTSKSSTCEMVYDFIVGSGNTNLINQDVASCLYAGIIGDTGSFRFPATSSDVHHMIAELKKKGLQHSVIHENLYDNFLEDRLRFIGHVLLYRMEVFYEYNAALISIPKSDLLKFNVRTGDTEGLVNYPLSIQGIKLAGLVIDRDEERKWSFRSKGNFDVNTFARTYFNGGGHFNASGGRSADSLQKTVQLFKNAIKENATQLQ